MNDDETTSTSNDADEQVSHANKTLSIIDFDTSEREDDDDES